MSTDEIVAAFRDAAFELHLVRLDNARLRARIAQLEQTEVQDAPSADS